MNDGIVHEKERGNRRGKHVTYGDGANDVERIKL